MSKAKKEVTQETVERVKDKVVKAIAQNSLDEPVDDYMIPESVGIRKGDYPEQDPETTKTLWDLAEQAARLFGDKTFLRYEKDDEIYEKSYREFLEDATKLGVSGSDVCHGGCRRHRDPHGCAADQRGLCRESDQGGDGRRVL